MIRRVAFYFRGAKDKADCVKRRKAGEDDIVRFADDFGRIDSADVI
jgi:hypothetical protein